VSARRLPAAACLCTSRALALLVGAALALFAPIASAEAPPATVTQDRPRIGLALGGGGARGGAHVGVLKVLDELRIPVDCIAGTSMGALVGATFAAGATAAEIEEEILAISWSAALGLERERDVLPMQRKLAGVTHSNNVLFGISDGRLRARGGVLVSQHVEEVLRRLAGPTREITDFDRLPIPFRAVATDLAAGRMVVLGEGDLTKAMRASMAVPGVFSPVVIDGQVLADGGMMRNLPVDVARELCADVVIAVSLEAPLPRPEELQSVFALAARSIDAMIRANQAQQLESLTELDVPIIVPIGDIGSAEFERVPETLAVGERAARRVAPALQRYALSEEEYRRWRSSVRRPPAEAVVIDAIEFAPLRHASEDYLASRLRTEPGDVVTLHQIERDIDRVFLSGDFERVDYRLAASPDGGRRLVIEATEMPGTDFLRFDLGLAGSTGGDVLFALRADHRREWVTPMGGQWRNALQLGQLTELESALYLPVDVEQRFFVEPGLALRRSIEDIFDDGSRSARYDLRKLLLRIDGGINLGNRARAHAGLHWSVADYDLDIGDTPRFDFDRSTDARLVLGAIYDTRDSEVLPTRGSYAHAEYTSSSGTIGGDLSYNQFEAVAGHSGTYAGELFHFAAGLGRTLRGELPRYRDFRIGGIRSFPALDRGELRGEGYWSVSTTWLTPLGDSAALFGQAFYAGVGLHAVGMKDRIDDVRDGTVLGLSLTLGARTFAGPFLLSLGVADNDAVKLQFALGRPIAEGSMLDQLH
jgi:NTE family protein